MENSRQFVRIKNCVLSPLILSLLLIIQDRISDVEVWIELRALYGEFKLKKPNHYTTRYSVII